MSEHKITVVEKIGASNYEAVWDISTGGLRITCDGTVIRDWPSSQSHVAVHQAVGGSYVSAAPSEEQLLAVIRFYAGK
ncbi:hypothetical protein A8H39_20615 [Paraburkholderia fungorum]|jgi:hypothetical protein|uniref:hypothetical protein n=1 Tax=Paraburkholderia fungorum TaxID=134537 RepID=UPI000486EF18|nr:hypothetical protein [Paraburkholderia fungorum]MBB5546349.1 hypothetical protein [Paraburkholderia fungorum]PNE58004.1 hypothetical protein A8H39_20615 [Paraburkholderia fungorum]